MVTMTNSQIDAAIAYNRKRGYSGYEIVTIQMTVGATADGLWGSETVLKVAAWQAAHALAADGKVGPSTWQRINEEAEKEECEAAPRHQVEVGCGLAAYDQEWPGHTPEEAMQLAWDTAVSAGCREMRYWSSEWLIDESLPNGGAKGNRYSGPWLAKQSKAGLTVGAWIDDPTKNAMSAGFVSRLRDMGLTRAALMINRSNTVSTAPPWDMRWSQKDLETLSSLYESRGIELVGTCWPRPSRAQIDAMCDDMAWVLPLIRSKTFEVDTEGNWTQKFLSGFASMREAAQYLASRMRALVGEDGRLELTTYTYHTENGKTAVLAPLMDILLPQAYSVRHRDNETVEWTGSLGPGRHQTLAISRAQLAAAA